MSNDANEANFHENAGHIARLKRRLNTLRPVVDEQERAETTGGAFDYYERSLQPRVMQNNTQKEQLDDLSAKLRKSTAHIGWLRTQRALLFIAAVAAALWIFVPVETWSSKWSPPVAAHAAGVAFVVVVLAALPIGGSRDTDPLASTMQ